MLSFRYTNTDTEVCLWNETVWLQISNKTIAKIIIDGKNIIALNAIPFSAYTEYKYEVIFPHKTPKTNSKNGVVITPKNEVPRIKNITKTKQ